MPKNWNNSYTISMHRIIDGKKVFIGEVCEIKPRLILGNDGMLNTLKPLRFLKRDKANRVCNNIEKYDGEFFQVIRTKHITYQM